MAVENAAMLKAGPSQNQRQKMSKRKWYSRGVCHGLHDLKWVSVQPSKSREDVFYRTASACVQFSILIIEAFAVGIFMVIKGIRESLATSYDMPALHMMI